MKETTEDVKTELLDEEKINHKKRNTKHERTNKDFSSRGRGKGWPVLAGQSAKLQQ